MRVKPLIYIGKTVRTYRGVDWVYYIDCVLPRSVMRFTMNGWVPSVKKWRIEYTQVKFAWEI